MSNSRPTATMSASDIGPSGDGSVTKPESMSSPGCLRCAATSPAMYWLNPYKAQISSPQYLNRLRGYLMRVASRAMTSAYAYLWKSAASARGTANNRQKPLTQRGEENY